MIIQVFIIAKGDSIVSTAAEEGLYLLCSCVASLVPKTFEHPDLLMALRMLNKTNTHPLPNRLRKGRLPKYTSNCQGCYNSGPPSATTGRATSEVAVAAAKSWNSVAHTLLVVLQTNGLVSMSEYTWRTTSAQLALAASQQDKPVFDAATEALS